MAYFLLKKYKTWMKNGYLSITDVKMTYIFK